MRCLILSLSLLLFGCESISKNNRGVAYNNKAINSSNSKRYCQANIGYNLNYTKRLQNLVFTGLEDNLNYIMLGGDELSIYFRFDGKKIITCSDVEEVAVYEIDCSLSLDELATAEYNERSGSKKKSFIFKSEKFSDMKFTLIRSEKNKLIFGSTEADMQVVCQYR